MVKKAIILGLTLLCSGYSCLANWALHDLVFIKEAIHENHPGIYNHLDPEFRTNLDLFFSTAQSKLKSAQDDDICKQVLRQFGRSFNDIHLRIVFPQPMPAIVVQQPTTRTPFVCDVKADVCYVRIPTFSPNKEETDNFRSIIDTMATVRKTPHIVFDVHGNGGGSSMWGKQIADALFGAGYTHHKRALALENQYVEWRASESNINYLCTDVRTIIHKDFGKESKVAEWVEHIINGMQKALNAGDMLYRDHSNTYDTTTNIAVHDSFCTSTIIVVIDERCASACLSFIDELKLMGTRVILVGKQTMADSLYMECRALPLPSGKGTLVVPTKMYRNRPRGHNIPYTPDIEYTEDINYTQAILNCVFNLINP